MKKGVTTFFRSVSAYWRVLRYSQFDVELPETVLPDQPCLILGNGPSLIDDMRGYEEKITSLEMFCVGRFAEFAEYAVLKPRHYVFADPMWWLPDAPRSTIRLRDELFAVIGSKTKWTMNILAPFQAESVIRKAFKSSPFIVPVFFNSTPVSEHVWISKHIYDSNYGLPPVQNVLVSCIYLALRMKHKNIVLLGADHSWHETLVLDERNRVCLRDRHFYDKDVVLKPFTMDGSPDKIFTMDQLFFALGRMFEGYWSLARYAKYLHASIYNASSTTYIDAFPRTSLADVLNVSDCK